MVKVLGKPLTKYPDIEAGITAPLQPRTQNVQAQPPPETPGAAETPPPVVVDGRRILQLFEAYSGSENPLHGMASRLRELRDIVKDREEELAALRRKIERLEAELNA